MTGPDDSETSTRPISVAELLAKNGTIGAAPPGGRRRRRRGNSDAVTVAELTGEIPILRDEPVSEAPVAAPSEPEPEPAPEPEPTPEPEPEAPVAESSLTTNGNGSAPPESRPDSRPELADVPVARRGPADKPQRSHFPLVTRKGGPKPSADPSTSAETTNPETTNPETMSPDPVAEVAPDRDDTRTEDTRTEHRDELGIGNASSLQTYLKATSGPLFGGQTVADDLARQPQEAGEDADAAADEAAVDDLEDEVVGDDLEVEEALEDDTDDEAVRAQKTKRGDAGTESLTKGQLAVRGLLIAVQSIVAVAFGAGLFIAFDQLWKWNSIVALILGVLVILGLVVGVRVVRKTEDIGSTLTAVAVGALVTFGPLALLQAS